MIYNVNKETKKVQGAGLGEEVKSVKNTKVFNRFYADGEYEITTENDKIVKMVRV